MLPEQMQNACSKLAKTRTTVSTYMWLGNSTGCTSPPHPGRTSMHSTPALSSYRIQHRKDTARNTYQKSGAGKMPFVQSPLQKKDCGGCLSIGDNQSGTCMTDQHLDHQCRAGQPVQLTPATHCISQQKKNPMANTAWLGLPATSRQALGAV